MSNFQNFLNTISPTDYIVWSCDLMYIHHLDIFYKSYGSTNSPGVIWGHRGKKGQPREKYENSANLKTNYVIF